MEWSEEQYRHQRRTMLLAGAFALGALILVLLVIGGVIPLNRISVLGFPLGFYLAAQGLVICAIIAAFWAGRRQEQIDHDLGESDEA